MSEKIEMPLDGVNAPLGVQTRRKSYPCLSVSAIIVSICVIVCTALLLGFTRQKMGAVRTNLQTLEEILYELVGIRVEDSPEEATRKFERKMRTYADCDNHKRLNGCNKIDLKDLAYYYSSPERMLASRAGFTKLNQSEFSRKFGEGGNGCHNTVHNSVLINQYGQLWCQNNNTGNDYFLTAFRGGHQSKVFRYWTPSQFTSNNQDNYELTADEHSISASNETSRIINKKPGVYLILAKVTFKGTSSSPGASIFRNGTLVARCVAYSPVSTAVGMTDVPCNIFQILHLQESSQLELRVTSLRQFSLRKTELFVAIWKLHDGNSTNDASASK